MSHTVRAARAALVLVFVLAACSERAAPTMLDPCANDACVWFRDFDGDGFGDAGDMRIEEAQPAGFVRDATDCDDQASDVHPNGVESCNALDDDCNGVTDDTTATYFQDSDGDGFGDDGATADVPACGPPGPGYVTASGDCDDDDMLVSPGAADACNLVDDDCDGTIDEGRPETCDGATDEDCDGTIDEDCACAHPEDTTGVALWIGCSECTMEVCAADTYCCDNKWDDSCVTQYASKCVESTCAHPESVAGAPLEPDCSPCVTIVCGGDAYCCTGSWDSSCVAAAGSACSQ